MSNPIDDINAMIKFMGTHEQVTVPLHSPKCEAIKTNDPRNCNCLPLYSSGWVEK